MGICTEREYRNEEERKEHHGNAQNKVTAGETLACYEDPKEEDCKKNVLLA
jgi:hypothetical protein